MGGIPAMFDPCGSKMGGQEQYFYIIINIWMGTHLLRDGRVNDTKILLADKLVRSLVF